MLWPRQASEMLRRRSGVRRSGLSLQMVQGGGWGGAAKQGRRHFPTSCPTGRGTWRCSCLRSARGSRAAPCQDGRSPGRACTATRAPDAVRAPQERWRACGCHGRGLQLSVLGVPRLVGDRRLEVEAVPARQEDLRVEDRREDEEEEHHHHHRLLGRPRRRRSRRSRRSRRCGGGGAEEVVRRGPWTRRCGRTRGGAVSRVPARAWQGNRAARGTAGAASSPA